MKRSYITASILAFPIVVMFFWILMIQDKISKAETIMIAVTGYDPRDLLSGHYVVLRPVWDKTDCSQFENNICDQSKFDYSYRFYLPEQDAKYLDNVITRTLDFNMHLEFAMPNNSLPIIKELYIDNITWKEWLKTNSKPRVKDGNVR